MEGNAKKETIIGFENTILGFYRAHGRKHLPWRKKRMTAYEVWVSEIMLQQTQVDRVIGFYAKFLRRFPNVRSLAEATWEEFLPYYQGLGYYQRGRNMLKAAQMIVRTYEGMFPRKVSELKSLPGVGEYTARAILSFTHADDHMAWDTNFQRVFGRFFYGSKDVSIDRVVFENSITANKRDFNGAIMDFGSLVCVKKPKCERCPLNGTCVYKRTGGDRESAKSVIPKFPLKTASAWVFLHRENRVYYSSKKTRYSAFHLPFGQSSRIQIQRYFFERYALTVSVRPPFSRCYIKERPVVFVRAQILLGKPAFKEFTKQCALATIQELEIVKF